MEHPMQEKPKLSRLKSYGISTTYSQAMNFNSFNVRFFKTSFPIIMRIGLFLAEIADGNEAAECHCLVASEISRHSEEVTLGEYVIEWKRFAIIILIMYSTFNAST